MGVSHNRWHVRDVAIALLVSMTSASESATAVEVIDDQQRAAAWISDEALEKPLSTPVAAALRRAVAAQSSVGQ